jgi:hypothetical protein
MVGYGFGVFVNSFAGMRELSHDGNTGGFSAQLATYPDSALTVAVLTNGSLHDAEGIEKDLSRYWLGIPAPPTRDLEVPNSDLELYTGYYQSGAARTRIWTEAAGLVVMTPKGSISRMIYQGDGEFIQQSDPTLRLRFDGSAFVVEREGKHLARMRRVRQTE